MVEIQGHEYKAVTVSLKRTTGVAASQKAELVPEEPGRSTRNRQRKIRKEDDILTNNVATTVTILTLTILFKLTFHPLIRDRQDQSCPRDK